MSATIKWEAHLTGGNPAVLHQLVNRNVGSGHFWLWGGINDHLDCRDNNFSFSSAHFDDFDEDPDLAWQVAHELLSLFNGALSLILDQQYPFRIGALLHNGRNLNYAEKLTAPGLLGALPPSAKRGREHEDSSLVFRLLSLACEHQDAFHLVKLFELPGGWTSYYKILETLESYTTMYGLNVPVDQKIKKSLELTANNFSISGFDSRHGFKQQVKKIKTASLTIEEARPFIIDYARKYLAVRYGSSLDQIPTEAVASEEE
ncbi:hypothetical protein ACLUUI_16150 [Enterobacterales bacterium AW_CKDN230030176-1A_HGKHYDSX7]